MNNLLVTCSIVFSLFYLTSAKSVLTYQQIADELGNLTKLFKREFGGNSSLVPKLEETRNISAGVISCRALESLKNVTQRERKHLHALEHYLDYVKSQAKQSNQVKCEVSDIQEDLISFLESLYLYFQYRIFNHTP